MKTTYIKMFFFAVVLLVFNSCSEEETLVEEKAATLEQIEVAKQGVYEGLFEYARLLSIAIQKNTNMNEALQNKALELQQTGYYEQEFYVGMQGEEQIKAFGSKSLNTILSEIEGAKSTSKIDAYLQTNPAMSVLLIGDGASKEFSNRVYVDNGFDDRNPMEIIYYYENGMLYSHTISEEPTSKGFIVRNSEVYIHEEDEFYKNTTGDQITTLFTYADGRAVKINTGAVNPKLVPIDDDLPGGGGGGGSTPSGCTETCERDCEDKTENLWRFRTEDDYDGAFKGKGEWFFVIIWADGVNYTLQNGAVTVNGSSALSYLRTGQINDVSGDNSWHYPNFSSIIWNREPSTSNPVGDGSRMKVACFESDGGGVRTISFTLTYSLKTENFGEFGFNFPVSFTIDDGDDLIGEYIVEYCHDIGYNGFMYHPAGDVDFQHNER